jgi:ABC-type transporter Mla subunit MlaD
MATEAHRFQVGVFVIVATVIAVGGAIWLGASRFFESTERFVTYFSESVQGLDPGSAVKYRGVPAGRVQDIRIVPDGDLIEVVIDMDTNTVKFLEKDPDLRATLQLSGITGLRYIEMERRSGTALNESPQLTFKAPYKVIPSARSSYKAVESALSDIYDKVMQVDFAGIADDTRATLQSANQLLHDDRVSTLLTNAAAASASANELTRNLERMSAQLSPAVQNANRATAKAEALFAKLNTGVKDDQLGQALEQINRLAQSAQQFVVGLQATTERFERTVSNLQSLTEQLRSQPSLLLFSEPPARRNPPGGN